MLCIYADYKSDESYTPSKISVRVGNNFHNLQEIRVTTLHDIVTLKLRLSQPPSLNDRVSSPLKGSTLFSPCSSSSSSLQQLEMVEPSGWIHISLMNQVRNSWLYFTLKIVIWAESGQKLHRFMLLWIILNCFCCEILRLVTWFSWFFISAVSWASTLFWYWPECVCSSE